MGKRKKEEVVPVEVAYEPLPEDGNYTIQKTDKARYLDFISKMIQYVDISNSVANIKKTAKYVVQVPADKIDAFNNGDLVLNTNEKTGKTWAQLVKIDKNGKRTMQGPLQVKEEFFVQGNPFHDIAQSAYNLAMQQQMAELTKLVGQTYKKVERIEKGQQDDRLSLIQAGREGLILALTMDEDARRPKLELAINNLMLGRRQVFNTFKRRVEEFEEIPEKAVPLYWKEFSSPGYFKSKDREYYEIQDCYALYLEATRLMAVTMALQGQKDSIRTLYDLSVEDMNGVDFSKLETLGVLHPNLENMIYDNAVEFVEVEKDISLEEFGKYRVLEVELTGKQLLEAFGDGKE